MIARRRFHQRAGFVAGTLAASVLACSGEPAEPDAPVRAAANPAETARHGAAPLNLIVILVDTLRADHLGYHGYTRETSPTLDALAAQSSVFLRHRSQASRTGPSVATLITGLHPRSHGVVNPLTHFDAKGTLHADRLTLAEILGRHGYRCAGFAANVNVSPRFGFSQGYAYYTVLGWKSAEAVNRLAFEWLDERAASGEQRPLCLYIHYIDPHSPYRAPAPYASRFTDPSYDGAVTGDHRQLDQAILGRVDLDDRDIEQLHALYDAEILYLDAQIEKLLDELERHGALDRSLLVFLSDHGEEFREHGSLLHGYTLYEEQLRIPLLFRHPDLPAQRIEASSRQMDVLPTILELLDIPSPAGVQGSSLLPLMRGASEDETARPVFAQASLRAMKTVQLHSYTRGPWKYIETLVPEPREQLFQLEEDPGETQDRFAAEPEEAARLREEMRRFRDALPVGRSEAVDLSEEEKAQLRAMGYLPEQEPPGADSSARRR